ncbi:MAG: AbrB/MazE/SpoVT family DNA-binding domain-containing protein [Thaumarchaeota archaeon]|nr:AbrB/MazE/SpoVT family DNA-binding domain-containing protein [Nitrososphaerota archaeon]MDE1867507.1 AbrB/MazE/SpoVT family DNA-binding domain-containing protein [Nitrososphaerota archaeon]
MSGNDNQYEPTEMFREWIQRSGKAQMDFMRTFGDIMNRNNQLNPLDTLKEMTDKTVKAQSDFVQNLTDMQSKNMNNLFNPSQFLPSLLSWGTFKTSVGSNGRISIPEAERDALGIKEDDLVQVIVMPVERRKQKEEVEK